MRPQKFQRVVKGKIVKKRKLPAKEIDLTKPWVSNAVKEEFNKKDQMLQKAKNTSNPDDWEAYKNQREKCMQVYNEARTEYIGQHPEEVRIPQLMPEAQVRPVVNSAPVDYTADVVL